MAQTDALKKYLDAGMAFTQLTRSKAEQVVKELVSAGGLQKSQARGAIDELVERSRRNAEVLAEQVRKEVDAQLANMGLARKADLERLDAELIRLKGSGGPPAGEGGAEDRPPGKAPATKAPKASQDEVGAGSGEAAGAGGSGGGDGGAGRAVPPKRAPAKKTAKKTAAGQSGVSTELPVPQAGGSGGDPGGAKPPAPKRTPVTKTAKKTSGSSRAGVGADLPGGRRGESSGTGGEPKPAKKPAKAAKKQG